MSKAMPIEELGEDDFIPLIPQHHHDAPCECGHRHAEHSMFGSCHGCRDCNDSDGSPDVEHEHAYERCSCTHFALAAHAGDLALTG